jgi:cobalt/nickel transport system permease protein
MHIPDGFLSTPVIATTSVLAAGGLGLALRQTRRELPPRRVPLLGVSAAFIFAAQMLNFPVAGGTSGHLIGATLAAVLLGPTAAVVVMSAVLLVQCFIFADGGVTALGANIFNMAIVGTGAGYAAFLLARRLADGTRGTLIGSVVGAWCSTVAASVACAGELAASRTVAWGMAFPAMTSVHMLIGAGEALITALVLGAVARSRPELLRAPEGDTPADAGKFAAYGLIIAAGLALFVAPFACGWPDGLEKVADTLGFGHRAAETPLLAAPLPDYALPGVASELLATALAGVIGTLVMFWFVMLALKCLAPRAASASR